MIDTNKLLLDPIYAVDGRPAVLTVNGVSTDLTVIDLTAGTDINASGLDVPVIKPAAMIRRAELDTAGVAVTALKGATLVIADKTYEVANWKRKPIAGGDGEVLLVLADGDV